MVFSKSYIVNIQPCPLMYDAENFQIRKRLVEDKIAINLQPFEGYFMAVNCMEFVDFCSRIFQPCLPLSFPHFIIEGLAGKHVFDAEICMELEGIQVLACCSNFWPYVKGQQVRIVFFFRI